MRILLADDHRMMRDGLRALLERAGIEITAEASNGREAVELARSLRPDVVVMDISMPELNGLEATRQILEDNPRAKVIVLSMNADRRYVQASLDAGAIGYLLKDCASDELVAAVRAAAGNERYVTPELDVPPSTNRRVQGLTSREREVLQLLAEGFSSKAIAGRLGIAVPTVETHRRQISAKLGLRTIAELTKYAIREGITPER